MDTIIIDPEFRSMIPKLTQTEYDQLAKNIVADGCRDSLVVWKDQSILLDGHNRYRICQENNIPYSVSQLPFETRDNAKVWIIRNQFGRRSLNTYQRSELALELESIFAKAAKERQGARTDLKSNILAILPECPKVLETREEVAKVANVSPRTIQKVKYIRDNASENIKEKLRTGDVSINSVFQDARRKEKEEVREQKRVVNRELIEKSIDPIAEGAKFSTILIDPPWDWGDEGDCDQFGRARPTYHTMPLIEIAKLPLDNLSDTNCHLYMWTTNRSLPKVFDLIGGWGFRYVTCLTWCKPSFGIGNYFRGSTEHVMFAVKGSQPLNRHDVGTWFSAPRGKEHSSKPESLYDLIESCSPGPYLEMFARKERINWTSWGAEI